MPNTEVKKCVRVCPCARVHVCICPLLVKKHCSHKQLIEFRHVISDLFWTVDGTASISSVSFHHRKPLERYLPVNENGWNSHFYMFKEYMFICMALCLKSAIQIRLFTQSNMWCLVSRQEQTERAYCLCVVVCHVSQQDDSVILLFKGSAFRS